MAKVSETIEIKASKKKVFDVITDFEAYPEFLPETKKVTIDKKSKNTYIVTFTIEVVKSVSYTLDMRAKPPSELSWTLVKGEIMKSNTGRWLLEEVRKGVETQLESTLPYLRTRDINGVTLSTIDLEKYVTVPNNIKSSNYFYENYLLGEITLDYSPNGELLNTWGVVDCVNNPNLCPPFSINNYEEALKIYNENCNKEFKSGT